MFGLRCVFINDKIMFRNYGKQVGSGAWGGLDEVGGGTYCM